MKKLKRYNDSYFLLLIGIMFALIMLLSILSPYFFTLNNFKNVLNQSSLFIILSVGMTFVISAGEIDLSVGAILAFAGMSMGMLYQQGIPSPIVVILGLIISMGLGCINGWITAYGRINSFIVTLSSMTILRGLILLMMNAKSLFGFGTFFGYIGSGDVGIINVPIVIALVITVIAEFTLRKTKYGNYCLFLGSNETALNRTGVNVKKYKMMVFALSGLCAGIAGLIVMSRLNSAEPLAGQGYEMSAIAAVILGGTNLQGGKGTIKGTFVACLILNIIDNGLTLMAVSTHYQEIITGVIIILSVVISDRNTRNKKEV